MSWIGRSLREFEVLEDVVGAAVSVASTWACRRRVRRAAHQRGLNIVEREPQAVRIRGTLAGMRAELLLSDSDQDPAVEKERALSITLVVRSRVPEHSPFVFDLYEATPVDGDAACALAVLTTPVQARLQRARIVRSGGGELTIDWPPPASEDDALHAIDTTAELVAELDRTTDVPRRLLANVESDPGPRVRRQSLSLLLARFGETDACRAALSRALEDDDPEIRLLSASRSRPPERLDALIRLARAERVPAYLRARALRQLGELIRDDEERVLEAARQLLSDPSDEVATVAVDLVSAFEKTRLVDWLSEAAANTDGEAACAIARALGATKDRRAEPALLGLLERATEPEEKIAAIDALAVSGTPTCLAALKPRAGAVRESRAVKLAADVAIDVIARRLGEADPGRLSIAEPAGAEGAVSIARSGAEGAVSITGPDGADPDTTKLE